ncbi:MAG: flavodoxin domain-containing protein [Candidatus Omnitrophica bacterium]|nr:flavodoxin domain-containing protein [Candidatus Omnitrophota bacterium]
MAKAIVIYYSQTGNTKKMAEFIYEAIEREGVSVDLKKVEDTKVEDLLKYDAILIGSPTYYGDMASPIKKFLDDSVKFHGSLDGKVGAAFSSAANIGGGNETTVLNILKAMLIHGMIIQGDPKGSHYGPVSIDTADERVKKQCLRLGKRVADLLKALGR